MLRQSPRTLKLLHFDINYHRFANNTKAIMAPPTPPNQKSNPFATFLIIGPTCFFLGILFAVFPYDYNVLWASPEPREPYFDILEQHLKFMHASPPLIPRILHIVIGTGLVGFLTKLYKASEANMLFDGASLVLYMCAVVVYVVNIVKGLRVITYENYDMVLPPAEALLRDKASVPNYHPETGAPGGQVITREDSLRVLAASNTILALVLVGVLVLQAGQWYAQKKEFAEMAEMDLKEEEAKKAKAGSASKKKQ